MKMEYKSKAREVKGRVMKRGEEERERKWSEGG